MGANTPQVTLPQAIQDLTGRLQMSYADRLTSTIVEGVVRDCYQPFADVRITSYVPMFVEHDSRSRLRQLTSSPVQPSAPALPSATSDGRPRRSFTAALRRLRAVLSR
ncbi:hypothetical protein J5X84_35475 [Streptosporangiaceae bacterium NEAU-GS5]|nr:hypothetical protein [Streptosporangiaceae bacterium NEAU-GS5]